MRRALAGLSFALLALSCGGPTVAPPARLVGAHDLQLVRNLLIVTSSDRDELRALDLEPPGLPEGTREFLPAPDPIEPLSIPVAPRPSRVVHDITWGPRTGVSGNLLAQGADDTDAGSYIFASASGGEAISVVASGRSQLIEVGRLTTPAPITATAAWADVAHALSHLWYTTWDGQRSSLYEVQLPLDVAQTQALTFDQLLAREHYVAQLDGEAVVDLLVLPGAAPRQIDGVSLCNDPQKVCLALATRSSSGAQGRVLLADLDTLQLAQLHFPGPVKKLATHAATEVGLYTWDGGVHQVLLADGGMISGWDDHGGCDGADGGCDRRDRGPYGLDLGAGQRVWGLMDEEACLATSCAGAMAVDSFTGQVAHDLSGQPMLPINLGDALLSGLSLAPEAQVLLPLTLTGGVTGGIYPLAVLGAISGTNGTIDYFEGSLLQQIDVDPAIPQVTLATLLDNTQTAIPYAGGPLVPDAGPVTGNIVFADGVWHSDQLLITHEGILPGAGGVPTTAADGTRFTLGVDLTDRVRRGDLVVVHSPDDGGCLLTVDSVDSAGVTVDAGPQGQLPDACANRTSFDLRAQGTQPDVVASVNLGFLLRCGPNQSCERHDQPYFNRPLTYDPKAPTFHIDFGPDLQVDGGAIGMDYVWSINLDGHFAPFVVGIDPTATGCNTQFAGSLVLDRDRSRTFIAFPSANGVIEIDQTNAVRGVDTTASVCYR